MPANSELLRLIPKVDDMLNNERILFAARDAGRGIVLESIREGLEAARNKILRGESHENIEPDMDGLVGWIISRIESKRAMNLKKVVNGTGIILHTNLGRSPLNGEIRDKVWEIAENYSNLEFDVKTGKRGSRYDHVSGLLAKLTGAESSFAVNNNAAAVLLALSTFAKGAGVVVSRGELVEIGESFRLPEVLEQSGARLIEVGSTNKTRLSDYQNAIEANDVGVLLKVNTSNYKIVGFTEEVEIGELKRLGAKYGIPVIHDLGSGALIDLRSYGVAGEGTVSGSVSSGADITCFSGDKLLGGPQAGVISGSKSMIDRMKKNPLTRALRIDKLTLAALEATLRLYADPDTAVKSIPVLSMMTESLESISKRADQLYELLKDKVEDCYISVEDGYSQVGGGSLPLWDIPTRVIGIKPEKISVRELECRLRGACVPVIVRIHKDCACLDVRTVKSEEYRLIAEAFEEITWE